MQFSFKPVADYDASLSIVSYKDVINHSRTLGDVWRLYFCSLTASSNFQFLKSEMTLSVI